VASQSRDLRVRNCTHLCARGIPSRLIGELDRFRNDAQQGQFSRSPAFLTTARRRPQQATTSRPSSVASSATLATPFATDGSRGRRGGGDRTIGMGQEFTYQVPSPMLVRPLIALVTFDQAFGSSAPMRFDLQVVPRETLQCPQLPPTAPES